MLVLNVRLHLSELCERRAGRARGDRYAGASFAFSAPHLSLEVEMSNQSKNGTAKRSSTARRASPQRESGVSYDAFKEYEGRRYTGMKIGRSHTWKYDPGNWKETKITPDLWQIRFDVTKRRAGRAPEGSGVPVGTDYHWYIVGHSIRRPRSRTTHRGPRAPPRVHRALHEGEKHPRHGRFVNRCDDGPARACPRVRSVGTRIVSAGP